MRLGIDVNRHKEIIVKAISALLLLLLRYFKLNHVYQVGRPGKYHSSCLENLPGLKVHIALYGTPSQSYGASLAIWDHTVLPATD